MKKIWRNISFTFCLALGLMTMDIGHIQAITRRVDSTFIDKDGVNSVTIPGSFRNPRGFIITHHAYFPASDTKLLNMGFNAGGNGVIHFYESGKYDVDFIFVVEDQPTARNLRNFFMLKDGVDAPEVPGIDSSFITVNGKPAVEFKGTISVIEGSTLRFENQGGQDITYLAGSSYLVVRSGPL